MIALSEGDNAERGPTFEGIPEPTSPSVVLLAPAMHGAPALSPKQYLYTYSDEEWEDFTVEWVRALDSPYKLVTRMGGAGDRGADVAACLTRQGTNGEWHCYQCKHYEEALRPADAWPEMVKIFLAKVLGVYELPARYVFVAPKIGASLTRYLANPATLKTKFFEAWGKPGSRLAEGLSTDDHRAVEDLAHRCDFSMFEARDLDWILELHATTPNYARRFPAVLKPRPPVELPPSEQRAHEAIYVQQLLAAYNEKYGLQLQTLQEARDHSSTQKHFTRQRECFYSAESLRVFARESVPYATYEAVETDLFEAVVEVEEREYDHGYDRLAAVLDAAAGHQPNPGNILAPVVTVRDRKGLCHQLANDKKLTWCKEESS